MDDYDSCYDKVKKILKNELLRGAFNTFLYLPSFMRTLYLNHTNGKFYEIESYAQCHPDREYQPIFRCTVGDLVLPVSSKLKFLNCRSFMDSAQYIDISCFYRSTIYISYLFIVELNRFLMDPIMDWYDACEFLKKLKNTAGYKEYRCWVDLYKCGKFNSAYEIRLKYFRPNQPNSIATAFQENRRMLLKTIAANIAKYWYPRTISARDTELSSSYQYRRDLSYFSIDNINNDLLHRELIDIISYEDLSGLSFREYILSGRKPDDVKYLDFLIKCIDFYEGFSKDSVDIHWTKRSSKKVISSFITPGNPQSIKLPPEIFKSIIYASDPPYEDLFDSAVEFAIHRLLPACRSYMLDGIVMFDKISEQSYQPSPEPSIEGSVYDSMEDSEEEEYTSYFSTSDTSDESEAPRNEFINNILKNRGEYERFKAFLNSITEKKEAVISPLTDMDCYIDIEKFKLTSKLEKPIQRDDLAGKIKRDYLTKKYFFSPHSPANRTIQLNILGGSGQKLPPRPSTPVLLQVQKHVLNRLTTKWLKQYRDSEDFQKRLVKIRSSLPKRSIINTKSNSQFVFMDAKSQTNSHELLQLRKTLTDPEKCSMFRRYAKAKNERHAKDIDFWIEIQKYKGIQHRHCSTNIVKKKIDAIIECYFDSSIPPRIQVSVPAAVVTKTMESKYELGPYIFRLPQTIINKCLLGLWNEYNAWCEKYKGRELPFVKLEMETQQKRLVKQLLREKQTEEERDRAQLESMNSQRAPSRRQMSRTTSITSTASEAQSARLPSKRPPSRTGSSASLMTDSLRPVLEGLDVPAPVTIHWKYSETIEFEMSDKEKRRQHLLKDILDKGMFKDDEELRDYISHKIYKPKTAPSSSTSTRGVPKGSKNSAGSFGVKRGAISQHAFDRTKLVSIHEKEPVPSRNLRRRATHTRKSTFRKFSKDSVNSAMASSSAVSLQTTGSRE